MNDGLGGGFFPVKELDSFLQQAAQNFRADLHLMRRNHGFVDSGHQQFVADLFGQRAVIFLEKASFAGDGFNHAQALQLGVGLGDGVAVDAQFLGQRTNGRERVSRPQSPGSGGITDLIDQLEINRFAGFKIELKHHC